MANYNPYARSRRAARQLLLTRARFKLGTTIRSGPRRIRHRFAYQVSSEADVALSRRRSTAIAESINALAGTNSLQISRQIHCYRGSAALLVSLPGQGSSSGAEGGRSDGRYRGGAWHGSDAAYRDREHDFPRFARTEAAAGVVMPASPASASTAMALVLAGCRALSQGLRTRARPGSSALSTSWWLRGGGISGCRGPRCSPSYEHAPAVVGFIEESSL